MGTPHSGQPTASTRDGSRHSRHPKAFTHGGDASFRTADSLHPPLRTRQRRVRGVLPPRNATNRAAGASFRRSTARPAASRVPLQIPPSRSDLWPPSHRKTRRAGPAARRRPSAPIAPRGGSEPREGVLIACQADRPRPDPASTHSSIRFAGSASLPPASMGTEPWTESPMRPLSRQQSCPGGPESRGIGRRIAFLGTRIGWCRKAGARRPGSRHVPRSGHRCLHLGTGKVEGAYIWEPVPTSRNRGLGGCEVPRSRHRGVGSEVPRYGHLVPISGYRCLHLGTTCSVNTTVRLTGA